MAQLVHSDAHANYIVEDERSKEHCTDGGLRSVPMAVRNE
jgi:hypothetical protein